MSLTERLKGTFNQSRKDTSASIQRRTSSAPTRGSKVSPVIRIREWLDTCSAEHEHHCSGIRPDQVHTFRPCYLVDVVDNRLVRTQPTDRYMTLSYVWGSSQRRNAAEPPAQLAKTNLDAYLLSLPENIPQTILDAMWLTKKLGTRLLWVDRLCIVRDDEEDRENHIRHMAYVFANSYLTIVAAYGDANTGLLPLNPRRASRSSRSGPQEHNDLVLNSNWYGRGWTLQELLYSRRAVFFFEDHVTWKCHCEIWQGSPLGMTGMVRGRVHNCSNRLSESAFAFQHPPWPDLDEYARIALEYSARRVTVVDDTVPAFAGITHVLSRIFPGGFVYGMPLMFLDIALLWRPQASIRRRAVTRPPFLPSWSWMGWWFDGVPVDLNLWKASADYIEDTKWGKDDQTSKRFQPSHAFKIRPMITWNLTDRSATAPVSCNGLQFRDLRSSRRSSTTSLPPGWSKAGPYFKHDSDSGTLFKYPIPVEDPPEEGEYAPPPGEKAFPGPYLSFKTTGGVFDVDYMATMSPHELMNPPIAAGNIYSRSHRWIGEFRAHDGWLGIQSSNYGGDEKLEFVAISMASERRGSYVLPPERFEENMDEKEIIDIVNVLWIERIGAVAYRRGLGHVLQKYWEATVKDVEVLLG